MYDFWGAAYTYQKSFIFFILQIMSNVYVENLFIKSQILNQLLEQYEDPLSLSIKLAVNIDSVKHTASLFAISTKLQSLIEKTNVDLKKFYEDDIYWYLMFLAYGEDSVSEEEDMIYIDRYHLTFIPGRDYNPEIATKLIDYLKNKYANLVLKFTVILDSKNSKVESLLINYDRPNSITLQECIIVNSQIIIDAFDSYDYQYKK